MVFGFFETHWSFDQIPDLTGKVAIVTGGNSGLGYITCLELARKNAKVYMASRNKSKAEEAIIKIKEELTKSKKEGEERFDLSKLSSGKSTAEEFLKKENRLDMLINNAGIMATPYELSPDGIELQACNGIGHYGLTSPTRHPQENDKEEGSQVRMSIWLVSLTKPRFNPDFSSLETLISQYLFNNELQRRLQDTNIHCLAVHPGVVDTDLFRGLEESYPIIKPILGLKSFLRGTVFLSPEQGTITQLYAATSPEITEKKLKGKYLVPYAQVQDPSVLAQDKENTLSLQFWSLCESLYESKI
ncbi:hypothetical protein H4Q26_005644 [Puccinia striiformis f. sp. tritici PST-130]|nr:hypothetical protein H4Q26_005644 [Puccinia striiformis f. sp. tritici PST-130]